jgi:hypothetical protein
MGEAIAALDADRALAKALGDAGYDRAQRITWHDTIDRLVEGL